VTDDGSCQSKFRPPPLACEMVGEAGAGLSILFLRHFSNLERETNVPPGEGGYSAAPVAWEPWLSMGREQKIIDIGC